MAGSNPVRHTVSILDREACYDTKSNHEVTVRIASNMTADGQAHAGHGDAAILEGEREKPIKRETIRNYL